MKFDIANNMNQILGSQEYRKVFERPALQKKASSQEASGLESLAAELSKISEKLDNAGLEEGAKTALKAVAAMMKEARSKKAWQDESSDEGDVKMPAWKRDFYSDPNRVDFKDPEDIEVEPLTEDDLDGEKLLRMELKPREPEELDIPGDSLVQITPRKPIDDPVGEMVGEPQFDIADVVCDDDDDVPTNKAAFLKAIDKAIYRQAFLDEIERAILVVEAADKKKKADPKAEVRNRPAPVFDAKHPKVKDNKDHFPIDTIGRARNALVRSHQFDGAPPWWKGSLKELQNAVAKAVHGKYPAIGKEDKKK
jgi:hypothetical protein